MHLVKSAKSERQKHEEAVATLMHLKNCGRADAEALIECLTALDKLPPEDQRFYTWVLKKLVEGNKARLESGPYSIAYAYILRRMHTRTEAEAERADQDLWAVYEAELARGVNK